MVIIYRGRRNGEIVATISNAPAHEFALDWNPPPCGPRGEVPKSTITRQKISTLKSMVEKVYPGVQWLDPSQA